jgi:Uma2 family endonuclease
MSTVANFTLDHYEHMVEVGAFSGEFEKRVELLRGEIVSMSPIGPPHHQCVILLTEWSYEVVPRERMVISVQGPVRIPDSESEPQPDLVWAVRRDYSKLHAEPHEVLLLVEVADTSLEIDRGEKLEIYAKSGIQEYWIVNLIDEQIEVHRKPSGRTYQELVVYGVDAEIRPLALAAAVLKPSQLFGD